MQLKAEFMWTKSRYIRYVDKYLLRLKHTLYIIQTLMYIKVIKTISNYKVILDINYGMV
jgi:hypothetical protein